jgi:hypothetical protein
MTTATKGSNAQRRIQPEDVPQFFDDGCIERLARFGKLLEHADVPKFKTEIQRAAKIYLRDAGELSSNERRQEVSALFRAASRRRYGDLKICVVQLCVRTRDELNDRGARFRPAAVPPGATLLDDLSQRDGACETVVTLTQCGGRWVEGRKRRTGRRSRTWEPLLHAPEACSHPPRRAGPPSLHSLCGCKLLISTPPAWHRL